MADLIPGLSAKYGVPEWLVRGMVGAEGGTNADGSFRTSPAGARGPAQLMPGTAASLAKRYGINPNTYAGNLEGGVAYLGEQLKRFKRPDLALSAYNSGPGGSESSGRVEGFPETQAYVRKILGGGGGNVGGAHTNMVAAPPAPAAQGLTRRQFTVNMVDALQKPPSQRQQALFNAVMQMKQSREQPPAPSSQVQGPAPFSRENADASWGGSKGIADQFAGIGLGLGLKAVSEKRDRMNTKSGGVSDHWTGSGSSYAYDLSNGSHPTPQMDQAAHTIAAQLGVEWDGRSPLEITKTVNGYRVQVLYRTNTGGNHFDHIHVGVRRVQ